MPETKASTALAKIDQARKSGAIIFAKEETMGYVPEQYEPMITMLEFDPADFAPLPGGNMYPQKKAQHAIQKAAGISFIPEKAKTWESTDKFVDIELKLFEGVYQAFGNYSVYASAVAIMRGPDGTIQPSSGAAYEFNVTDRFNEDRINESKGSTKSLLDARRKLLQKKKFATRNAATGAELAAIREISGIPTAFKKNDMTKPMCFGQIIESQSYKNRILGEAMKTPDGRAAVINKTLGLTASLYGKDKPKIADQQDNTFIPEKEAEVVGFSDDIPFGDDDKIDESDLAAEQRELRDKLQTWKDSGRVSYLNDKVGKIGDPHKEHMQRIETLLATDPIDVDKANQLLHGLDTVFNR